MNKFLTAGLEDYLEAIYIAAIEKNKSIKSVELANMLNISRASVSEAIAKLVSKGLINYESYGLVTLTPKGTYEAKKIYDTHKTLKSFFETVLNISPDEAGENACKIEHIISQNILDEIKNFTSFCNNNPEIMKQYRQERQSDKNLSDREISGSTYTDS